MSASKVPGPTSARRLPAVAAAALVLLALTGCSGGQADPVGTWGVEADGEPHLVLAEGGGLAGSDGCNRLTGSWEADGDRIEFGTIASTLMACEGVDAWLAEASTGTVSGDTLTVFDAGGSEIGTLERD